MRSVVGRPQAVMAAWRPLWVEGEGGGGFGVAAAVEDDLEFTLDDLARVELFEGPCGEVAGVGVKGFARLFAGAVNALEFFEGEEDLAA